MKKMREHINDGHRLLQGWFDFTADIIKWHHQFQPQPYPTEIPESLHEYNKATQTMVQYYGRLLSLADVYDALHRVNDKFSSSLTGEEIKQTMFEYNPDQKDLIHALFSSGIFTTLTYS